MADPKVALYEAPNYGYYGYSHLGSGHHRTRGFANGSGHLYSRGYGSYGYPSGGYYAREYLKGTLILDIIDARSGKTIWRGWAVDSLDSQPEPAMVRMYINEAVESILERFPPGQ